MITWFQKFLIQEDKEGFIPCIIYLLNNELNENDEKFFKENILDKTILDNKNDKYNKKLKYLKKQKKVHAYAY